MLSANQWKLHTPTQVVELLRVHRIASRRRMGQSFLIDANILRKMVEAGELTAADCVIEIGAGLGILTRALAMHASHVVAIEKDPRCMDALKQTTRDLENVELVCCDALDMDLRRIAPHGLTAKVVANLPYNISKEVLRRLFDARQYFERAVLMLQEEVAERLIASPGTKAYGLLAVATYLFSETEIITSISPNSFFPPPRVKSAIARMKFLRRPRLEIGGEAFFFSVVTAALRERRKTLFNSLASVLGTSRQQIRSALSQAELDGSRRGETLTPAQFATLAKALMEQDAA